MAFNLTRLRQLASDPSNRNHAPKEFVEAIDLSGSPAESIRSAWRLFIETGNIPTKEEIHRHLLDRKAGKVKTENVDDLPVGNINSHFLDSGAFTLWTVAAKWHEKNPGSDRWGYYDTDEFYNYLDCYVEFVKKWGVGVNLYANVDVIPNPELTWRNQQYLERKGLKPVPVVHFTTDLSWLKHYMNLGYDVIGLGGLVGSTTQDSCRNWIEAAFEMVCDQPSRLPKVKLHGFGVTSYKMLIQYPWYSVDSTSWTKSGAFGTILIPHKRGGKWTFDEEPYAMKVSIDSPDIMAAGRHFLNISDGDKAIIQEWLEYIKIPVGKMDNDGNILEMGVVTRHTERRQANLIFFEMMRNSLPVWPWPFKSIRRKGLGIW